MMSVEYQMGVRMDDELRARIEAAAKHNKQKPSTFVRCYLAKAFHIVPDVEIPKELLGNQSFNVPAQEAPSRKSRRQRRNAA